MEFAEVPFIASYSSAEDIIYRGAEPRLRGCVLLTGLHGDNIWDKLNTHLNDQIVRGGPRGSPSPNTVSGRDSSTARSHFGGQSKFAISAR